MITREMVNESISLGNLNPKMINQFLTDVRIKSFSYDYQIQKDLVHFKELTCTLNPKKSEFIDCWEDGDRERAIIHQFEAQVLAAGFKEKFKRSDLYGKYIDSKTFIQHMKYFRSSLLVFINGMIYNDYRVKVRVDKIDIVFRYSDLHEMRVKEGTSTLGDDIVKDVRIFVLPNAIIGTQTDFNSQTFSIFKMKATNFDPIIRSKFKEANHYFGFWINNTNGHHFLIPYMEWDMDNEVFVLPDLPPTNYRDFSIMVIGTEHKLSILDINPNDKWFQVDEATQMPLPKDNFAIMIRQPGESTYIPNDLSVTLTEYYPNVFEINNPNGYQVRLLAFYNIHPHNDHLTFDNEIAPYMRLINLGEKYKDGTVPKVLKEFKPIPWDTRIGKLFEDFAYKDIDLNTKWTPFLWKLNSIQKVLKKWMYMYVEYERRTYGWLPGWYHHLSTYPRLQDKIRIDTAPEITEVGMYKRFATPHYMFSYKNPSVVGESKSFTFFIDGRYRVPTANIVYRGYQYVYFPCTLIRNDSVIEVERFDGEDFTHTFNTDTPAKIELDMSKFITMPIIADSIFFVDPDTNLYLPDGIVKLMVHDDFLGDVLVDPSKSVFTIKPEHKVTLVVENPDYQGINLMMCCKNSVVKYETRISGVDFARGWERFVNLNPKGYIANVKKSIIPRIRIYTQDGRLISKTAYRVRKRSHYSDDPQFLIFIPPTKEYNLKIQYLGYDERLIYHKESTKLNGYINLEGRISRAFSLAYHDVYLDGFRLTKYDIDIISPFSFVITAIFRLNTIHTVEVYEKCHVEDDFVKFEYDELSDYIMDKLVSTKNEELPPDEPLDEAMHDYYPDLEVDETKAPIPIDTIPDEWFELIRGILVFDGLNGDIRKDYERWAHVFERNGRLLLNADDRFIYPHSEDKMVFFSRDHYNKFGAPEPLEEFEKNEYVIEYDPRLWVYEDEYIEHGFTIDDWYSHIYDNEYEFIRKEPSVPTQGYINAENLTTRYWPTTEFRRVDDLVRYIDITNFEIPWEMMPDIEYKALTDDWHMMSEVYPGIYDKFYTVPDDLSRYALTNFDYFFKGCKNLTMTPSLNMTRCREAKGICDGCTNLTWFSDSFNISQVNDLTEAFRGCESLHESHFSLEVNATITDRMFEGCTALTDSPIRDFSNIGSMREMFKDCANLPSEFSVTIDASRVETFDQIRDMFKGTPVIKVSFINLKDEIFDEIDDTNFGDNIRIIVNDGVETIIVGDSAYKMSDIYPETYGTMEFTPRIKIARNGLHTMEEMFKGCFSLEDISEFPTETVQNFKRAFEGCASLPVSFPWVLDLSGIEEYEYLFDMFKDSGVADVTFSHIKACIRDVIGLDLSDNIEYIRFTEDKKIFFYGNRAIEGDMYNFDPEEND